MNKGQESHELRYELLSACFTKTGFIKGKGNLPTCNYEEYLHEIVNESKWFMKKTGKVSFKFINNQDHGEPDIEANGYSLDFKLIAGQSALRANKLTSQRITHINEGAVAFGTGEAKKAIQAVRIHSALKSYDCNMLINLKLSLKEKDIIEQDVVAILTLLEKEKNLLLFLPYDFSIKECEVNVAYNTIEKALNDCFLEVLKYRKMQVKGCDTYLCCIFNQSKFLLFEYDNNEIKIIDIVDVGKSKTFVRLKDYSTF